jgi:regulator of protease activity HflC (stomatin/prohibitin superfamily)
MNIMNKKWIIVLTPILFVLYAGCASTIQPGNQGLMWRPWGSGLEKDKVYQDGIVWHWPWNDVIEYEVQWRNYQEMISILTSDDLHMNVTISVVLRPDPTKLYYLAQEVGEDYYERLVRPEFFTITRNVLAKNFHNKLPENSPLIEKEILAGLKEHLVGKHINFDNVTLDHIMYSPLVTEASDRKLATLQMLEQKEFESGIAEKDAEIQRIRAKGQRDAQIIIDEGLTRKYLQFRSLEVQESLSKSSNSKFFFVPIGEDGLPVIINTEEK